MPFAGFCERNFGGNIVAESEITTFFLQATAQKSIPKVLFFFGTEFVVLFQQILIYDTMKKIFRFFGIVLLIAAVSAGTTLAVLKYGNSNYQISNLKSQLVSDSVEIPAAYSRFASLPQAGETDFTQAAELSVNAVVHVKTTYRNQVSSQQMDIFEFFFGRPGQQREMPAQQASGSGVIIDQPAGDPHGQLRRPACRRMGARRRQPV